MAKLDNVLKESGFINHFRNDSKFYGKKSFYNENDPMINIEYNYFCIQLSEEIYLTVESFDNKEFDISLGTKNNPKFLKTIDALSTNDLKQKIKEIARQKT